MPFGISTANFLRYSPLNKDKFLKNDVMVALITNKAKSKPAHDTKNRSLQEVTISDFYL